MTTLILNTRQVNKPKPQITKEETTCLLRCLLLNRILRNETDGRRKRLAEIAVKHKCPTKTVRLAEDYLYAKLQQKSGVLLTLLLIDKK